MTGTVLILGASGRFGRTAAEAFWNAGWRVSIYDRTTKDLESAARGMDVIVNGWNPPHPEWKSTVPGLTLGVIKAAKSSGATVFLPGNIYVFGKGSGPTMDEHTPHAAQNPLGHIRINMEATYRAAGVPVILLRAGDFLDTEASGNWFDKVITKPLAKGRLSYPAALDTPHSWAYLPDMARAAVALCGIRDQFPTFADIAFPGYTLTGRELATLCAQAIGKPVRAKRMSWVPLLLARPFWPPASHLLEMRYLWRMPHQLSATKFNALLPNFTQTDPAQAIRVAVSHVMETKDQPIPDDVGRHPVTAA